MALTGKRLASVSATAAAVLVICGLGMVMRAGGRTLWNDQAPAPGQDSAAKDAVKVSVDLVTVDVVVEGKDGNFIEGLRKGDFEVYEKVGLGTEREMPISHFDFVSARDPDPIDLLLPAEELEKLPPVKKPPIVLIDDLNTSLAYQDVARQNLIKAVKKSEDGVGFAIFLLEGNGNPRLHFRP